MKIAVIGTGNVGTALATGWSKAGHTIFLGVRDQQDFKGKSLLSLENISVLSIAGAIAAAEVILLSVPPKVIPEIASYLKDAEDKIIIDPSNSFPSAPEGHKNCFEALTALTNCKNLVKAFNNTGFQNMANPKGLDTFVAGDSEKAKTIARQLAEDIGFANCYDFGGSDKAGLLEQLAISWINLAYFQGMGPNFGINVVKR